MIHLIASNIVTRYNDTTASAFAKPDPNDEHLTRQMFTIHCEQELEVYIVYTCVFIPTLCSKKTERNIEKDRASRTLLCGSTCAQTTFAPVGMLVMLIMISSRTKPPPPPLTSKTFRINLNFYTRTLASRHQSTAHTPTNIHATHTDTLTRINSVVCFGGRKMWASQTLRLMLCGFHLIRSDDATVGWVVVISCCLVGRLAQLSLFVRALAHALMRETAGEYINSKTIGLESMTRLACRRLDLSPCSVFHFFTVHLLVAFSFR